MANLNLTMNTKWFWKDRRLSVPFCLTLRLEYSRSPLPCIRDTYKSQAFQIKAYFKTHFLPWALGEGSRGNYNTN